MALCSASKNRSISRYHFAGRKTKNTKEAFVAYIELVNFVSLCRIFCLHRPSAGIGLIISIYT